MVLPLMYSLYWGVMRTATDLTLDRVAFVWALGIEPDPWQRALLRFPSDRVLLNCSRLGGKSTMTGIIALHRALYHPAP